MRPLVIAAVLLLGTDAAAMVLEGSVAAPDGRPVAGATVACTAPANGASVKVTGEATTDAQGEFGMELPDSPQGCIVSVRAPGRPRLVLGPTLSLAPGRRTPPLDIFLPPMVTLDGIVVDDTGRPMAGVTVHASGWTESHSSRDEAVTDASGRFAFRGWPAWSRAFLFARTATSSARCRRQPWGRGTAHVTLRLGPLTGDEHWEAPGDDAVRPFMGTSGLFGSVVDEQGRAAAGATVRLFSSGRFSACTTADSGGAVAEGFLTGEVAWASLPGLAGVARVDHLGRTARFSCVIVPAATLEITGSEGPVIMSRNDIPPDEVSMFFRARLATRGSKGTDVASSDDNSDIVLRLEQARTIEVPPGAWTIVEMGSGRKPRTVHVAAGERRRVRLRRALR